MNFWLWVEYLVLVFLAGCGVLQGVFTYRRISGLQFFKSPLWGYLFAGLLFIGPFAWFFESQERDTPPRVVEGLEQTILFLLGCTAAVFFTFFMSSVICRTRLDSCAPSTSSPGLGDLRHATYVRCLSLVGRGIGYCLTKRIGAR